MRDAGTKTKFASSLLIMTIPNIMKVIRIFVLILRITNIDNK